MYFHTYVTLLKSYNYKQNSEKMLSSIMFPLTDEQ